MSTFKNILRKLNNRYVYATILFLLVILVIDQFNLFEQRRLKKSLNDQKQQIEYYEKEISESKEYLNALQPFVDDHIDESQRLVVALIGDFAA